jgi:hypothetical protein
MASGTSLLPRQTDPEKSKKNEIKTAFVFISSSPYA